MTKGLKPFAIALLALTAACSSLRFEPTANWARDGGRLCALNRDPAGLEFRVTPRPCAQSLSEAAQG